MASHHHGFMNGGAGTAHGGQQMFNGGIPVDPFTVGSPTMANGVNGPGGANSGYRMLNEFEFEISRLREENAQIRYQKELRERDFENVMFENNTLYGKLENLENVFIGSAI